MNKLNLAIDAARNDDMERVIKLLEEELAEPELNLNCKSVQKRLATVWGYVKAKQAEQEPVAEALRLSEEAIEYARQGGKIGSGIYGKALAAIRSAKEPQITTPDVCGEVCVRAKLCYGCGKALDEANAKFTEQAEQEPFDMNDHPPHRLCECRKCMEYSHHYQIAMPLPPSANR